MAHRVHVAFSSDGSDPRVPNKQLDDTVVISLHMNHLRFASFDLRHAGSSVTRWPAPPEHGASVPLSALSRACSTSPVSPIDACTNGGADQYTVPPHLHNAALPLCSKGTAYGRRMPREVEVFYTTRALRCGTEEYGRKVTTWSSRRVGHQRLPSTIW